MKASRLELNVSDGTSKTTRPRHQYLVDESQHPPSAGAAPTKEFSFKTRASAAFDSYALGGADYDLGYVPSRVMTSDASSGEQLLERPPKHQEDTGQLFSWTSSKGRCD